MDKREHLKTVAVTLQAFYENRIVREGNEWVIVDEYKGGEVCDVLFTEMPPRHGKTRTLTNFIDWVLGKNNRAKFLYTSYNDKSATDTSRYVRDKLQEKRKKPEDIIYTDIFDAKLQRDNKAVEKWALAGQYFNFISAGKDGSVTGKGCDVLIVDDPVKNSDEALSELESQKTWDWFTGTLLSRIEEGGKIIVNHTRWPRQDLIQRYKAEYSNEKKKPYYELVFPAYDGEKMLCAELFSYASYLKKQKVMDDAIFEANYNQNVIDEGGKLYRRISTYTLLPSEFEERRGYCDYADKGTDFLASVIGVIYDEKFYVEDVVFTQAPVEDSTQDVVEQLLSSEVSYYKVESNNGGRNFALSVEEKVLERGGYTVFDWDFTSTNKETRIITNSGIVQTRVLMPRDWESRWPVFAKNVKGYMRVGKNLHDDGPDVLTMVAEDLDAGGCLVHG